MTVEPGLSDAAAPGLPEPGDAALVAALRAGDEAAFAALVDSYHGSLLRLAVGYVGSREVAEEVVQDTWVGVLRGLPTFEGRSSLKTWIYRILSNRAQTRGKRERRSVPFSSLAGDDDEEAAVEPERFAGAGHWTRPPGKWGISPEEAALSAEVRRSVEAAIGTLPPMQRQVITLRDIDGWKSDEVCSVLGLTETNQRVLLHRARSRVRRALEKTLKGGD